MSTRRPRAGFTLFEVLAAVAVLGILYTVLAGIAMDGLRHEGEAERRLRASLLADRVLADLEQAFAAGAAPPLGQTEDEAEEFTVEIDVRPFDLGGFLESLPGGPEPDADRPPAALLMAPARGNPPLVEIELLVRWIEGAYEQELHRITYGFDLSVATPALEALPARSVGGGGGEGESDEEGVVGPGSETFGRDPVERP